MGFLSRTVLLQAPGEEPIIHVRCILVICDPVRRLTSPCSSKARVSVIRTNIHAGLAYRPPVAADLKQA